MERPLATAVVVAYVIVFGHAVDCYCLRRQDTRLKRLISTNSHTDQPIRFPFSPPPSPPPPLRRRPPPPSPEGPSRRRRRPPPPPPAESGRGKWPPPPPPDKPGGKHRQPPPRPPPPPARNPVIPPHNRPPARSKKGDDRKENVGKKVGLIFVGVAVLLQIALGAFLGVRRWQISKLERRSV